MPTGKQVPNRKIFLLWAVIFKNNSSHTLEKEIFFHPEYYGPAVGIAASLLIFLVIQNEFSYDTYHSKKGRIYRVVSTQLNKSNGEINAQYGGVPIPVPDAMRQDFPQFEKMGAAWNLGQAQIYIPAEGLGEEKRFKENEGLYWTDAAVFDMFDFTWLAGNAKGLTEKNTVVLNESLAAKFFDNPQRAIGKTIQLWSFRIPLVVSGVLKMYRLIQTFRLNWPDLLKH
ncbi:MAG: ABC transporter permease [Bacteroidota bacterium]